jgi:hypothetical protein
MSSHYQAHRVSAILVFFRHIHFSLGRCVLHAVLCSETLQSVVDCVLVSSCIHWHRSRRYTDDTAHPRYFVAFQFPFLAMMPQTSQPRSAAGPRLRFRTCRMGPSACIPQHMTHTPTDVSTSSPFCFVHMSVSSSTPGTCIPAAHQHTVVHT